jgi:hypothetical protein
MYSWQQFWPLSLCSLLSIFALLRVVHRTGPLIVNSVFGFLGRQAVHVGNTFTTCLEIIYWLEDMGKIWSCFPHFRKLENEIYLTNCGFISHTNACYLSLIPWFQSLACLSSVAFQPSMQYLQNKWRNTYNINPHLPWVRPKNFFQFRTKPKLYGFLNTWSRKRKYLKTHVLVAVDIQQLDMSGFDTYIMSYKVIPFLLMYYSMVAGKGHCRNNYLWPRT